jgi:hypothetical protein
MKLVRIYTESVVQGVFETEVPDDFDLNNLETALMYVTDPAEVISVEEQVTFVE